MHGGEGLLALSRRAPLRTPPVAPVATGTRSRRDVAVAALPGLLRLLTLGALAGAATAPLRDDWPAPVAAPERTALVAVLDVSASMLDPGPGGTRRIDEARASLARAVRDADAELTGLVVFGPSAAVRVPLVEDPARVVDALAAGDDRFAGELTDLGGAIALAANQLRAVPARSRTALVATDGESNHGALEPATAARLARAQGVEVRVLALTDHPPARAALDEVARAGGAVASDARRPAPDAAAGAAKAARPTPAGPRGVHWMFAASALLALELGLALTRAGRLA